MFTNEIPPNSNKTFVPLNITTDRFHRANSKPEPAQIRPRQKTHLKPRTKTYLLRGLGRAAQ